MYIEKINGQPIQRKELKEVKATLADSQEIADIQAQIRLNALKDKSGQSVFAADSKEFIESIIKSKRGAIMLYYNDDELVGFMELTCPDEAHELVEEYGLEEHLPHEDYENMGVAESFVVFPKYRGNGLQAQMFERMEELALEKGITSLIGTVHPENIYSCHNFDVCDYETVAEIQSHGGPRFLKYKKTGFSKTR